MWEHKSCCVWLYICTTKSVVMCVCMSFHTKPHVSHVESDFLTASLCGRICGKVRAWSQKREDVFNSRPAIIAVHALDSCTCLWVSNYTKCVCMHAILSNIPLPRCSCKMNARFHLMWFLIMLAQLWGRRFQSASWSRQTFIHSVLKGCIPMTLVIFSSSTTIYSLCFTVLSGWCSSSRNPRQISPKGDNKKTLTLN